MTLLTLLLLLLLLFSPLVLCRFTDVSGHNYDTLEVSRSSRYRRETPPIIMSENHLYYTSHFSSGDTFSDTWYNLSNRNVSTYHAQLSDGYYLYDPVELRFRFPFYGHYVQSVAITTHGFLSTADILHSSLYLTQYIAPFSADFNPSLSPNSRIHYLSLPDLFVVQWSNVLLDTKQTVGGFTFQVQLRPSGEITFVYKQTPLTIKQTSKNAYTSVYGLADGFILNNEGSLYLYSYHNVTLPDDRNLTQSVYVLTPLPNCITATDTDSCNTTSCTSSFQCGWCESLGLCSDGLDRKRQEWYNAGCHNSALLYCSSVEPEGMMTNRTTNTTKIPTTGEVVVSTSSVDIFVVLFVFLFVIIPSFILLTALLVYAVYRYRNGGKLWVVRSQVLPKQSDQVILREADDSLT